MNSILDARARTIRCEHVTLVAVWLAVVAPDSPRAALAHESSIQVGSFGWSVANVGDVDADGAPDLAVGAPALRPERIWDEAADESVPAARAASAWVFSGRDFRVLLAWTGGAQDRFGYSVASAGDVDGDGHADVLVGAPGDARATGAVRLYSGRTGDELAAWTSGRPGDGFGTCVRASWTGAVPLLVVGAPLDEGHGAVWVFPAFDRAGFRVHGAPSVAAFGSALDFLPDQNDDGCAEIVVGAPGMSSDDTVDAPSSPTRAGGVFVVSGADGSELGWFPDPAPGSAFGACVRTIEIDSARATLAIGAPAFRHVDEAPGAVYLREWNASEARLVLDEQRSTLDADCYRDRDASRYGHAIAPVGDWDGDGRTELLVGAPHGFWCGGDTGWAEVVSGATGESLRVLASTHDDEQAREPCPFVPWEFGRSVDSIGDADGDGFVDLVVGAPDLGGACRGAIEITSGRSGELLARIRGARLDAWPGARAAAERK